MVQPGSPPRHDDFLNSLRSVAAARGPQTALVFNSLGRWQKLSWSAVFGQVVRAAAGLAHLGVSRGGLVAIDGEITPRLLIVAAAARSLGAELVAVPLRADRSVLDGLILDPRVQFVAGHGREAVAEWQQFSKGRRAVPILFDHVTPESRSPGEGVLTYPQLVSLAQLAKPGLAEGAAPVGRTAVTAWFAETTDWADGLNTALDLWLTQSAALAIPESQRAAARDQAELQPNSWLASSATLQRFAGTVEFRLPPAGSILRRLVDAALAGGRAPWHGLLRLALRRQTGLSRASGVQLGHGQALPADTRLFFERLGVPVTSANAVPATVGVLAPEPELSLAVAAQ